ncbi:interleukin-11 receptor subunit alpha [Pristis pectinata]|uniref:interleukin-11 receptor subunit alpha n=1 Tax=Pristis pectinata TaxID=685728 RepID=UPI00223DDD5F|nr:interleukin-11 receptor subunit alpha [Pristis pectinata]XP_051866003.1 interleukin-11 receptor subunit alpha [Pristis pectinata]XP_051866004.1 interleukin-11 receptor subunit alpha [Pristis pectinata]XP_051866005.1 interleukin-11 receptor subunit alpha [Pristis pectinata]XP_051866006.1 interleukin-11 receptor subunit alpha [Pristis pectinata]XP_051866007.1 interleukin-11 receptor subunit alpha [Pristis pectinata]
MIGSSSCIYKVLVLAAISFLIPDDANAFRGNEALYGRIGTDITLMCNAANDRIIQWKVNGTLVAQTNNTKVQNGNLVLLMASLPVEGNYSCHDDAGEMLQWTLLKLGYPPSKPLVHCKALNFSRIYCSWEKNHEESLPTSYIATYRDPSSKVWNCTTQLPSSVCQIDNPQIFSQLPYVMNVTAVNPVGHRTTLLEIVTLDIVQPDPPTNVKAEPVFGSPRRIKVHWNYPLSWSSRFELKFILEYKLKQNNFWSRIETNKKEETITDAIAAQLYVIRVKAKDFFDSGNWSDWSSEVLVTTWSETTSESIQTTVATLTVDYVDTCNQQTESTSAPTSIFPSSDVLDKDFIILISIAILVGLLTMTVAFVLWVRKKKQEPHKADILMKALPYC